MEQVANAPLWRYTTLKIGGEADTLCLPETVDELSTLLDRLKSTSEPWFILGGGSNLLISSKGVPGSVIRLVKMSHMTEIEPGLIEAGTGTRLPHLARFAESLNLTGLEFLVGVPGTVGGGVVMNAGAHGSCIANVLESATIFDTTKSEVFTLTNEQLRFEYRKSMINPDVHVVVSARFRLQTDSPNEIKARMAHNEDYRWKTQPLSFPSAGSTFKNPFPDKTAGFLLDRSGAKNLREGNAAVSAVHANFVINMGGATSNEVTTLLSRMQDCVYKEFEIHLKPEWKKVGIFTESENAVWNGDH
jgi:UDP-N-acetylmuramate dehydrogenase